MMKLADVLKIREDLRIVDLLYMPNFIKYPTCIKSVAKAGN